MQINLDSFAIFWPIFHSTGASKLLIFNFKASFVIRMFTRSTSKSLENDTPYCWKILEVLYGNSGSAILKFSISCSSLVSVLNSFRKKTLGRNNCLIAIIKEVEKIYRKCKSQGANLAQTTIQLSGIEFQSQSLMHATVKPLGPLTGSSCLLT